MTVVDPVTGASAPPTTRRTALISVDDIRDMARSAHAGQVDKLGRDYFSIHVSSVADRLEPEGELAVMAGLLHDVLEDTELTAQDLLDAGVPADVVRAVESVSKTPGASYDELIARAARDPLGRLVKLADNAQNLADNPLLAAVDPEKATRLRAKYETARATLLAAQE